MGSFASSFRRLHHGLFSKERSDKMLISLGLLTCQSGENSAGGNSFCRVLSAGRFQWFSRSTSMGSARSNFTP